ncbi:PQQ-dependent sugar dehydrogenase [Flaviaesturariibacter aridisoli]|uniref:Glucose/Sorbosone dehydrogenase domain-containing protein n=1 Tax=Flaviaesturariibacter aridisoli TaxID=2545761 RepID=A0A4R4E0L7_9BACT|nr:PQQ-dependent sugar dehydrogenase [Flaviaesturariibacter aridisoli]TCZ72964.1 hypothetical protein E0486_07830 [Flaviaesturariibacter aridisoli]
MNTRFPIPAVLALLLLTSALSCKRDNDDNTPVDVQPALQVVAENLVSPLSIVEAPDGSRRMFIVDQAGKIWLLPPGGSVAATPFLDLSSRIVPLMPAYDERGLLSLAFHPNFSSNGKLYVFYTAPPRAGGPAPGASWDNLTRVSEFTVSPATANTVDLATERVVLEYDHPQFNHNGGTLAFGPDGFLYISIGDGGNKDDVGPGHGPDWYAANAGGNAQNLNSLLGKVLRIDVNGTPYNIPADNPYATASNARHEIYAFGFRNPYRFSFDMGGTRQLILGDAGQSLWEEVNVVTRGGNYGWNVREGRVCFNTDSDLLVRPTCPLQDSAGNLLQDPVLVLKNLAHPEGDGHTTVVVGGNVYRGSALPGLVGSYVFGAFSQGFTAPDGLLYVATPSGGTWNFSELRFRDRSTFGYFVKGFGQDLSGEVYVAVSSSLGLAGTTGKIVKIIP